MADWHAVDLDFLNHRKTLFLERILGPGGCGHVLILWLWAAVYRCDGSLTGMTNAEIEAAARWHGPGDVFVKAIKAANFIDGRPLNYQLHNWRDRNEYFADAHKRRQTAIRQRRFKAALPKRYRVTHGNAKVTPTGEEKTGEDRTGEEKTVPTTLDRSAAKRGVDRGVDDGFEAFWSAYPRKVGKGAALKAWQKIRPANGTRAAILTAVAAQRTSDQWHKDGGQFIPHPATWLNQTRWEDSPDVTAEMDPARAAVIREYRDADPNEDWTGRKS